jgi:hypothetical protein
MGPKKTRKNQKEQEPVPQAAPLEQPQEEGKVPPQTLNPDLQSKPEPPKRKPGTQNPKAETLNPKP